MPAAAGRKILRALPALVVVLLFAFSLLGATAPPVPDSLVYPTCSLMLQSASGESTLSVPSGMTLLQPIGVYANVAACSLQVNTGYGAATFDVVAWDPVALSVDATTASLRSYSLSASALYYGISRISLIPPVVSKPLASVAEAPRATLALRWVESYYTTTVHRTAAAPAPVPVAFQASGASGYVPLPGSNGAYSHAICGGDQALQDLAVCQSVVRVDSLLGTDRETVAQRFCVPVPVTLSWVEVVCGAATPTRYLNGWLGIVDAQGTTEPPPTASVPIVGAAMQGLWFSQNVWTSHADFDHVVTLQPGHDYWLYVVVYNDYALGVRTLTHTESAVFDAGVGEMWTRTSSTSAFAHDDRHVLDFKIIGKPLGTIDVAPVAPKAGTLRLRAMPNPAQGTVLVGWTGARGEVAFEVLDARGARVARGTAGAGPEGGWLFRGRREDGRPLPGGVYFVRATDRSGQSAFARVVFVR